MRRSTPPAAPAVNRPSGNAPSGKSLRIVKALAWVILAVLVAGATATGVAYVRLRNFQTRLAEVDDLMAGGRDTAALDALRAMTAPAVRHGLLVREVGIRTVRVLVRLGRSNEAEDTADALATLVPPDDAEPWAFASPQAVFSLPQWVAGDALYGAERMAWDRWAGYRELLASLCARDRAAMENARLLLAARHPNNPVYPGKPKPVIRESDSRNNRPSQTSRTSPTGLTVTPPPPAPESVPPPLITEAAIPPSTAPVPVPPSTSIPAVVTSSATQESARDRAIRQLHDRQAAILTQLKILHAYNASTPAGSPAAQLRLDQHRAEMKKIARKSETATGGARTLALDQLREMKYREMQLQREAGPSQAVPTRQAVTLRNELAGIDEQLNALETESEVSQRL